MPTSKRTSKRKKTTKNANRSKIQLADGLVDASHLELIQGMVQGWEVVSDAISLTEPDTNQLIYVNPAWSKLYGYSAEECLGKCITILSTKNISRKLQNELVAQSRQSGWQGRLLNVNRAGAVFPVDLSTAPIKDQAGTIVGLLGAARSVRNTHYSDERIQELVQTSQEALSRELKKLLETVFMEEASVKAAPRPKQNKKQSNGNNADLIPGIGRLTQRELEIFTLIGRGLSTREIATNLKVSAYTVQTHRNHIKDKLNLPDSSAITYWAFQREHHKA